METVLNTRKKTQSAEHASPKCGPAPPPCRRACTWRWYRPHEPTKYVPHAPDSRHRTRHMVRSARTCPPRSNALSASLLVSTGGTGPVLSIRRNSGFMCRLHIKLWLYVHNALALCAVSGVMCFMCRPRVVSVLILMLLWVLPGILLVSVVGNNLVCFNANTMSGSVQVAYSIVSDHS